MKRNFVLLAIFALFVQHSFGQTYSLVWSDSFNTSPIKTTNWFLESGIGNSGWGNNELQYYTNRPENAIIINGNLNIIARKEMYQGKEYTSARMITKNLQQFQYGKVEARIKLPQTKGVWPAFWMLGSNIDAVSWPKCGEIDILEHVNTETVIHGTMHWDNNGHTQSGNSIACNVSNYHVYGIEWTADTIYWMLDNVVYHKYGIKNSVNNTGAFHKPFFLLLNMAVGGNWPGSPNANSVFPDTMLVDYINVYQQFPLSTTELKTKPNVLVYPNPVQQNLQIQLPQIPTIGATISIYNSLGVLVKSSLMDKNTNIQTIDVSSLANGNYYYRLASNATTVDKGMFAKQ
jgi:beta-glucanase (GH16 family)